MNHGDLPYWLKMEVRDYKGPLRLRIKVYDSGLEWLFEENLTTTPLFRSAVEKNGSFAHIAKDSKCIPFGFGGVGTSRRMKGHVLLEFPLTVPEHGELISQTISVLGVVTGIPPEKLTRKSFGAFQTMVFRTDAGDSLQGRNIVAHLSPNCLHRLGCRSAKVRELFLERIKSRVRQVWKALSTSQLEETLSRDPFEDVTFSLKERWCVISCPGNRTGLATRHEYPPYDKDEWLIFSGCNIDDWRQQLSLLAGLAEFWHNVDLHP